MKQEEPMEQEESMTVGYAERGVLKRGPPYEYQIVRRAPEV